LDEMEIFCLCFLNFPGSKTKIHLNEDGRGADIILFAGDT
jgi:hypothetical protein